MDAGRVLADEQLLGDLAVRPALDQQRQDVAFAAGQAEGILGTRGGTGSRGAGAPSRTGRGATSWRAPRPTRGQRPRPETGGDPMRLASGRPRRRPIAVAEQRLGLRATSCTRRGMGSRGLAIVGGRVRHRRDSRPWLEARPFGFDRRHLGLRSRLRLHPAAVERQPGTGCSDRPQVLTRLDRRALAGGVPARSARPRPGPRRRECPTRTSAGGSAATRFAGSRRRPCRIVARAAAGSPRHRARLGKGGAVRVVELGLDGKTLDHAAELVELRAGALVAVATSSGTQRDSP